MSKKKSVQPTSFWVAVEAGVSRSAVSRAYTPGASISDKTRRKVFDAAEKLGYRPNAIARSLRKKSSNLVGIVMADLTNPFYAAVLDKLLDRLRDSGHRAVLLKASRDHRIDELISELLEYQIDGLVIASTTLSARMAEQCEAIGAPVVLLNRQLGADDARHVCCDNVGSARLAADHLANLGRKRLAFLSGKPVSVANRARRQGFLEAAATLGLAAPVEIEGDFSYSSGYRAALEHFASPDHPDAVFCANDMMAMGLLDGLRNELGVEVPEQVAIIGFDDVGGAEWPNYDLTTIRQPIDDMANRALSLLFDVDSMVSPNEPIPGELVLRSTA